MENESEVVDSLISEVEKLAKISTASPIVEFINQLPSGWNAVVVAFGAAFFYKDPSNERPIGNEQQQRSGPIYSGGSSYVQGTRKDCCGRVFAVATVKMDGQTHNLKSTADARPKYCINRVPFIIQEKKFLSQEDLENEVPPFELIFSD